MTIFEVNREVWGSLRAPFAWVFFAWEELKERYRRSVFGIAWIPISFLLFVGVKVLVFSQLSETSVGLFSVHVVIGYLVWQLINALMVDSTQTFVRAAGYIKSSPLPYTTFVLQGILRNSVPFLFNIPIVLIICVTSTDTSLVVFLWFFPVYIVYFISAIWVSLLFGVIGARYRDLIYAFQTIMRVLFFLTPIIWIPSQLGSIGETISLLNPISHYINIIREPIMQRGIPTMSWIIVGSITVVGWLTSALVYGKSRNSIVHWI